MTTTVCAGGYLHHMQLRSGDPETLARFYADTMDMALRRLDDGDWLCEGPMRRMIITAGDAKTLGFAAFGCRDTAGLAAIRAHAEAEGVAILPSPSPLFDYKAFAVRDPDGNAIVFGLGAAEPPRGGLRGPIQHLTLATLSPEAIEDFYVRKLGFMTSDYVRDAEGRGQRELSREGNRQPIRGRRSGMCRMSFKLARFSKHGPDLHSRCW